MIGKKKHALHESTKNFLSYEWEITVKFQFEEVNTLDIEKAKLYYNQIRSEDLCDCDYCRNNIHEVKAAYPISFIDTHPITVSSIT